MDTQTTHGYHVRICYKSKRINYSKLFSDKKCGGKRKALKKAIEWRNETVKILGIEHYLESPYRPNAPQKTSGKNKSGIIGVTLIYRNEHYYWSAYFCENKKFKRRAFSVNNHGECKAFRLACELRFDKCGPLRVYKGHDFPCSIRVPFKYID